MTPTMLRGVMQAVADGRLPGEAVCEAIEAVDRGRSVDEALARLWPDAPPADALDEAGEGEGEPEHAPDELAHLFGALGVCRDERGACLLLLAAIASDWGVDAELVVGVDAEDEVDALLAAGDVDEAVELAREGAEALEIE